jgi:hypothetical protein
MPHVPHSPVAGQCAITAGWRFSALRLALAGWLGVAAGLPGPAHAQCQVANPSFEIAGSGGQPFGGWSTFGVVDSTGWAVHGQVAARIHGPGGGGWNLAGLWQALDSVPGEVWAVTGHVAQEASAPLTGSSVALVNVEWRDSTDGLIGYESFPVADAGSAQDEYLAFSVESPPAPAGTATVRLVLGVLQGPQDPTPTACFDHLAMTGSASPDPDEAQWVDFPGGRVVEFAGRGWRVKGPGWYGPGPNLFSDSQACVSVDHQGWLHLAMRHEEDAWRCSEVALEDTLGYGDYIFTTVGALDQLHVRTVLGLFLWQYGTCDDPGGAWWNPYNEFDIEFSRWGNPANAIGQFVAQPWDWAGNIDRFDAVFGPEEVASHAFRWLPDRVECRSWRGGPLDEAPETLIHSWTYSGPHIPRPEQPRVHLNLWQAGAPPDAEQEVVLADFTFTPMGGSTGLPPRPSSHRGATAGLLQPPTPNPANPGATIRYVLPGASRVDVAIYNLRGARVRTLAQGTRPAGGHGVTWNGRDDAGLPVAGGIYFCRLRLEDHEEVCRLLVLP